MIGELLLVGLATVTEGLKTTLHHSKSEWAKDRVNSRHRYNKERQYEIEDALFGYYTSERGRKREEYQQILDDAGVTYYDDYDIIKKIAIIEGWEYYDFCEWNREVQREMR